MKRTIARVLRRWANRLDPQKPKPFPSVRARFLGGPIDGKVLVVTESTRRVVIPRAPENRGARWDPDTVADAMCRQEFVEEEYVRSEPILFIHMGRS